jgi:hypothetical protein
MVIGSNEIKYLINTILKRRYLREIGWYAGKISLD